jgi:hypothetical protein
MIICANVAARAILQAIYAPKLRMIGMGILAALAVGGS